MYASNSFKKYDGYKVLKILQVISIAIEITSNIFNTNCNIQKNYCSGFTKIIRCINC